MAELAREPLIEFGDHSYEHPHMSHLPVGAHRRGDRPDRGGAGEVRQARVAFRPPFGEWSSRLIYVVQDLQLPTVTWDIVSGDPERAHDDRRDDPQRRRARRAPDRSSSFTSTAAATRRREALPVIVRELRERGFRFVQVSELMARRRAPARRSTCAGTAGRLPATSRRPSRRSRATCRRRRPRRGRSERRRAVAMPDRPRVAGRRAQPGRLDRRHRAVAGLGYRAAALGRYLARLARAGEVWVRARAAGRGGGSAPRRRRGDGRFSAGRLHRPAGGQAGRRAGRGWAARWSRTSRRACSPRRRWLFVVVRRRQPRRAAFLPTAGLRAASVGSPIWCARGRIELLLRASAGVSRNVVAPAPTRASG